ncbi:hypothetical protein HMPREF0063_11909 [Aeromicrobium marinum DSM 15272]|uniref:Uncharacterized protein n=1 Tax=Aeromicrobium marinum DSM 15272 TaxID=585531 RepID=E2SDX3_9ACTN|nr:hypothetical protein HMPREF0063_11909 [Aeromicrobium marinum DSM 15272]
MALQAARAWGERPTVFLGHAEAAGPWSERDRELSKSLLLYERSLCDGCGNDAAQAQDPDREGWYLVQPVVCAGCRAKELEAKQSPPEPGVRFRVVPDPAYVKRS